MTTTIIASETQGSLIPVGLPVFEPGPVASFRQDRPQAEDCEEVVRKGTSPLHWHDLRWSKDPAESARANGLG